MMGYHVKRRTEKLVQKFTTSPMLPILGWTKLVESWVTASSYLANWLVYAVLMTVVWVVGVIVWESVQETAEEAAEALTDGENDE